MSENPGVQFVLRVPSDIADKVDSIASETGLNRSQVVRLALSKFTEEGIPSDWIRHREALRPVSVR
jgi:predicted transcriptional regulator